VVDFDVLDSSAGRAVTDRSLEALDRVRLTLRVRFDAAIGQIQDPAVQSFALRRGLSEEPEADALHATAYEVPSCDPHGKTAS
jgi:hypothetical protein